MPLRTQRAVLAAKVEATEGTAETLAAANGILAETASYKRNQDMIERNPLRPTLSRLASIPGRRTAALNATVEMKGSGTAGTAPEWGSLIQACGFSETIVAVTSVTYAPVSTGDKSVTAALYTDGLFKKIVGARGNVSFGGAVGEKMMINFDMTGIEDVVTDLAIISPTYQTTLPKPLRGITFTLHGSTVVGSSMSIDMGNTVTPRGDFTKTSGYASVFFGDRAPVCNFVIEQPTVAGKDWYGIMEAGTEANISIILNIAAGNIITIAAPKFQVTGITEQDDGGKAMLSIDGKLNLSSGDDELTIALT